MGTAGRIVPDAFRGQDRTDRRKKQGPTMRWSARQGRLYRGASAHHGGHRTPFILAARSGVSKELDGDDRPRQGRKWKHAYDNKKINIAYLRTLCLPRLSMSPLRDGHGPYGAIGPGPTAHSSGGPVFRRRSLMPPPKGRVQWRPGLHEALPPIACGDRQPPFPRRSPIARGGTAPILRFRDEGMSPSETEQGGSWKGGSADVLASSRAA